MSSRTHIYLTIDWIFAALGQLYQAVIAIVDDPLLEFKHLLLVRLCLTAIYILPRPDEVAGEYGPQLSAPILRLWRRIFRRIAVALQALPEDVSLTFHTRWRVRDCFKLIDELDVAQDHRTPAWHLSSRNAPEDLAKEQEWRSQFKSEGSPFSNHLIFLLSRLLSDDDFTLAGLDSWRLRMLDAMSEEDRLVALKDDEHDDDPEETAGETIPAGSSDTGDPEQEDGQRDHDDKQTGPRLGALDEPIHASEQEDSVLPAVAVEDLGEVEVQADDEGGD